MSKSVYIIYGICEGPWMGRYFSECLVKSGYTLTNDARQANILISHSGGCFLVPSQHRARQIVFINPCFWPGKTYASRFALKVWHDFRYHYARGAVLAWLQKSAWNMFYLFSRPSHTIRMIIGAAKNRFDHVLTLPGVKIVRNSNDEWLNPAAKNFDDFKDIKWHDLAGEHDDCWQNPQAYIELL